MISRGATTEELFDEARKGDFVTMQECCRKMVLDGTTTVDEALKAINSTAD